MRCRQHRYKCHLATYKHYKTYDVCQLFSLPVEVELNLCTLFHIR